MKFGKPVTIRRDETDVDILAKKCRDNFNLIWGLVSDSYSELKNSGTSVQTNKSEINELSKKIEENEEIMLMISSGN